MNFTSLFESWQIINISKNLKAIVLMPSFSESTVCIIRVFSIEKVSQQSLASKSVDLFRDAHRSKTKMEMY